MAIPQHFHRSHSVLWVLFYYDVGVILTHIVVEIVSRDRCTRAFTERLDDDYKGCVLQLLIPLMLFFIMSLYSCVFRQVHNILVAVLKTFTNERLDLHTRSAPR